MHVAWVSAVNGDTVEIEEYNYGVRYTYGRRVIPKMPLAATFILKPRAGTTNSQPALAPSGTYTFTSQLAIKSQASLSSPTLDYYYAGESVRYDKVLEDDGQRWISYISYSGARRSPSSLPLLNLQTTAYQHQVATPSSPTLVSATIQVCPVLKSPSTELAQSFAMIKLLLPKVAHGLAISVTQVLDATSPSPNHKNTIFKSTIF